ncbi:hypothetical protein [Herbidospora sp. RD11066]
MSTIETSLASRLGPITPGPIHAPDGPAGRTPAVAIDLGKSFSLWFDNVPDLDALITAAQAQRHQLVWLLASRDRVPAPDLDGPNPPALPAPPAPYVPAPATAPAGGAHAAPHEQWPQPQPDPQLGRPYVEHQAGLVSNGQASGPQPPR